MSSTTTFTSYEQAREQHGWNVPERYNIAVDVCDRHPREKLAMIHEDFGGRIREVSWGELQDDSNRFANVLRAHGVEPGDRVAMLLPPTPRPRRRSSARGRPARSCCRCRSYTATRAFVIACATPSPRCC